MIIKAMQRGQDTHKKEMTAVNFLDLMSTRSHMRLTTGSKSRKAIFTRRDGRLCMKMGKDNLRTRRK